MQAGRKTWLYRYSAKSFAARYLPFSVKTPRRKGGNAVAFAAGFARRKNHTPHDEATGNGQNEQETERPVANSRILGAQLSQ